MEILNDKLFFSVSVEESGILATIIVSRYDALIIQTQDQMERLYKISVEHGPDIFDKEEFDAIADEAGVLKQEDYFKLEEELVVLEVFINQLKHHLTMEKLKETRMMHIHEILSGKGGAKKAEYEEKEEKPKEAKEPVKSSDGTTH